MAIGFENVQVVLDCAKIDENKPVIASLTPRGDIVFTNWDRESDLIAEEMGFGTSPCLLLEDNWDSFNYEYPEEIFPLVNERFRIAEILRDKAFYALSNADYLPRVENTPDPYCKIYFSSMSSKHYGEVRIKTFLNSYQHRFIETSIQDYLDVLNIIPNGLVRDKNPSEKMLAVAAIDKLMGRRIVTVFAGRVGRHIGETWRGIAIFDEDSNEWSIDQWIERV